MAIYHFTSKIFTRSKSHSAVSRAAEKLHDKRLDMGYDYSKKSDLLYKEIVLPDGAAGRFANRELLWNEVEACERRKDSQLARELEFSLPRELSDEQNIRLVKDKFVSLGMIAHVCIHHGRDNPHVMLTTRQVGEDRFGSKVVQWNKRPLYIQWREEWANYANKHLAKAGFEITIDHRSNKERGIDLEPQNKIGAIGAQERLSGKVYEEIARSNGERILADPGIAIDALTQYKSTFTQVDIAKFVNRHKVDKEQFDAVFEKIKSHKS